MAAFRHERDAETGAFVWPQAGNVTSLEPDNARARNEQTGNRPQGGRFSGSVCAHQRDDFAFFNVERDVPAGGHLTIGQFEAFGFEQGGHSTSTPR